MKDKCKKARCGCSCIHQIQIMKHPSNKTFAKGSIMEHCGYACIALNASKAIFMDNKHCECEMYIKSIK